MNQLHPQVVLAWRLSGLLTALLLTAGVAALEALLLGPRDLALIAPQVIVGLTAVIAITLALFWPGLRYRHWRWQIEPDRVLIERGVLWRSRSLIPRVRIQHVDTRSSPLQRWLGLSSLIIYTAGTRGADVEIPGLAAADAEGLREVLARLEELDERG